ncbi:MAG: hypothetical protein NT167_27095, partial [Verrucomicrobia bacterium]|nr:hypothetical protein [Verrucomicrobiota bacterium]
MKRNQKPALRRKGKILPIDSYSLMGDPAGTNGISCFAVFAVKTRRVIQPFRPAQGQTVTDERQAVHRSPSDP